MSGGPGSLAAVRLFLCFDFFYFSAGACIVLEFVSILHSRALGLGVGTHIFIYDCPVVRPPYQKHCLCRHVYANDPTYTH
jgi:hypothetical protein